MKQETHQSQQKDAHVRSIGEKTSRLGITACLGDLGEPDGGIDGECLMGERLYGDSTRDWEEEPPEIFDSHSNTLDSLCDVAG
jgi:hypothetical protein